jgi:hypothetical protein
MKMLPRHTARSLETLLIQARVAQAVLPSTQPLHYRELTARQLTKIYSARLCEQRTPTEELANPPFRPQL